MLPKNNFRKIYMSRLFLFEGEDHPYAENIYAQLEPPASMPKRLDECTKEDFENYPKLF
jgi:large subunit ribosomal protein L13